MQRFHQNGRLREIVYIHAGQFHRDDGPAYYEWDIHGRLILQIWYKNGNQHRDDGPAYKEWKANGSVKSKQWLRDGEYMTAGEIEKIQRPEKYRDVLRVLPQPIFEEIWPHVCIKVHRMYVLKFTAS